MREQDDGNWTATWLHSDLLAFVEQRNVVVSEDGEWIKKSWTFDLAEERRLLALLDAPASARRELPYLATSQLVVTTSLPAPSPLADFDEGTWHRIRLGNSSGLPTTLFRELDGAESIRTDLTIRDPPDALLQAQLKALVSIDDAPEATQHELRAFLPRRLGHKSVSVLNVGQGNCNAVCDRSGVPRLYLDVGAGCLQNTHTRPNGIEYCFTATRHVVLSHWDFDHWYGGSISKNHALARPRWLAPSQPLGVRTRQFAAALMANDQLRRWPSSIQSISRGNIELVKCVGTSKNDSGIALAVATKRGVVLCPADAAFNHLPIPRIVRGRALAGLVATHHGAGHVGNPIPKPGKDATIAFSFGRNNSFGHPAAGRGAYHSEGWVVQLDTPNGGVSLGRSARQAPCGGAMCSVDTAQS